MSNRRPINELLVLVELRLDALRAVVPQLTREAVVAAQELEQALAGLRFSRQRLVVGGVERLVAHTSPPDFLDGRRRVINKPLVDPFGDEPKLLPTADARYTQSSFLCFLVDSAEADLRVGPRSTTTGGAGTSKLRNSRTTAATSFAMRSVSLGVSGSAITRRPSSRARPPAR